jgi:hypothetical protein
MTGMTDGGLPGRMPMGAGMGAGMGMPGAGRGGSSRPMNKRVPARKKKKRR